MARRQGRPKRAFKQWQRQVGRRLREAREEAGLTQAELAEATRYTQQMVSRYESGRVPPAWWFVAGLEEAGLDPGAILARE